MEQRSETRLRYQSERSTFRGRSFGLQSLNLRLVWSLMEQKIKVSIEKPGFILAKRNATKSITGVHHFLITGLIQGEGLWRTFSLFQALRVRVCW